MKSNGTINKWRKPLENMTYNAGMKFTCVDPGTIWGEFYEGAFLRMLDYGYLEEGSMWLHQGEEVEYRIVGSPVPLSSDDDTKQPQRLEAISER